VDFILTGDNVMPQFGQVDKLVRDYPVEMGTEEEVRLAVGDAIEILGPTGFVLSPVDNITVDEPRTWKNIEFFIDEWRRGW
jgi:hypothetical protein